MTQRPDEHDHGPTDLLIVGGGIHGLFAAYDAAERGLSVTLVERADFGSGLSFNHQRTIHGGLRALQGGHLAKARRQIVERRTWARIAPHLMRPLPFLVGTYRWTPRARTAIRAGFRLYDAIGRARNAGVAPELHLPRTRLESAAVARRLFPGIATAGLSGGAIWYDYQVTHSDRLVWAVALAARQHGARLINHAEAVSPLRVNGRLAGFSIRNTITGEMTELRAAATLVAAGAGLNALLTSAGASDAPPLLRAMNVLLDRPARDIALAAPPRPGGRMLTAVPWRGYVLVGTSQSADVVDPAERHPPSEVIATFLADINLAFPALRARRADIRLIHHGLTPAAGTGGDLDLMPEPRVVRHGTHGVPGLVSLVGVKFTTARTAAAHAIDAVCAELGRPRGHSRTAVHQLPHAGIEDVEGQLIETLRDLGVTLDREIVLNLSGWYGTEASAVARVAASAGLVDRLSAGTPVLAGEVAYAVRHADAQRLGDVVLRRTPLGSAGHPGPVALGRAADVMGGLLGWTPARRAEEIALVESVYPATPTAEC